MAKYSTRFIIISGLFMALEILLTYVFSIQTVFMRFSFTFIPMAIYAAIYGPWFGGCTSALASMIGCILFTPALFFPGFFLSSFLASVTYGYALHKKPISLKRICIAFFIVVMIINLCLNTLWLAIMYDKAVTALFAARLIKELVCFPLNTFIFYTVYRTLSTFLAKNFQMDFLLKHKQ